MSFRIHCPECDVMFEPPAGVLSAECPFCGGRVEVPQIRAGQEQPGFRKRIRKGPGWWVRLRSHLPRWGNSVLATSFVLILCSCLIQAWLAANRQRSFDALRRAVESWQGAVTAQDDAAIVKAADALLVAMSVDSARESAERQGLRDQEIRERRRRSAIGDWRRRFEQAGKGRPDEAFVALKRSYEEAGADADLAGLGEIAIESWRTIRSAAIETELSQIAQSLQRDDARTAWQAVLTAERLLNSVIEGDSSGDPLRARLADDVAAVAGRYGIVIDVVLKARTFAKEPKAKERVVPVVANRLGAAGYLTDNLRDPELSGRFRKAAKYLMEVELTEKYGRPFEETPHRTTILEFRFVLKSAGRPDELRAATVRTPRIPAKTAIGMSRLQLAKQSDERVERRLEEAAWESIEGPITQALGSLPPPH